MTRHDVVVVGAGLAGLRAARVLARRGLDVVVLDAPCTATGTTMIRALGHRRVITWIMSRTAAPLGLVIKAIRSGNRGSGRLRSGANRPSAASFCWS